MAAHPRDDSMVSAVDARRQRTVTGVALVGIGLLALAGHLLPPGAAGVLFLPALGLIFLAWAIAARTIGLLIPGGILSGIGLGVVLSEHAFAHLDGEARGGVFLLAFAAGWGLIALLATLVDGRRHWWPLIPGGILAVIGLAVVTGGAALQILAAIGGTWPIGLIAVGLYLLLWRKDVGV